MKRNIELTENEIKSICKKIGDNPIIWQKNQTIPVQDNEIQQIIADETHVNPYDDNYDFDETIDAFKFGFNLGQYKGLDEEDLNEEDLDEDDDLEDDDLDWNLNEHRGKPDPKNQIKNKPNKPTAAARKKFHNSEKLKNKKIQKEKNKNYDTLKDEKTSTLKPTTSGKIKDGYTGRLGAKATRAKAAKEYYSKKAFNSNTMVGKAYNKVKARVAKANQSRNMDHGKKDWIPGYRTFKKAKTLVTGKY